MFSWTLAEKIAAGLVPSRKLQFVFVLSEGNRHEFWLFGLSWSICVHFSLTIAMGSSMIPWSIHSLSDLRLESISDYFDIEN